MKRNFTLTSGRIAARQDKHFCFEILGAQTGVCSRARFMGFPPLFRPPQMRRGASKQGGGYLHTLQNGRTSRRRMGVGCGWQFRAIYYERFNRLYPKTGF